MLSSRELVMRRLVALVLIVALSGCSTVQTVPPAPAEVCAQPGLWAVLARPREATAGGPPTPLSGGRAAAAGAWKGGAGSVETGAEVFALSGSDPLAGILVLALSIAIAPVAALIGAGAGIGVAHPEAEIAAAKKSMTDALDAAKPAGAIRARVVALGQERAARQMYDCGDLRSLDACERQSPDPVAVVLSMTVSPPYFEVEGRINPDLRLLLSADAEVVRASEGATVYRRSWVYRGGQHGYFDFAADGAKLFTTELNTATDALAAKVVDDLLIGGRAEVHPPGAQPEGSVWTVLPPGGSNRGADCP
jgi:hypothetical protein